MLENVEIKPITGTFANMLISDTGIVNAGLKDWENDFKMMKAIGMDHIFIIRTECEENGIPMWDFKLPDPATRPGTTWDPKDPENRKYAIFKAISDAEERDVVLISGRGNRKIMCDGYDSISFLLDKDVVEEVINDAKGNKLW